MKKQNKKERGIIALLLVCAVFMTVGFAGFSAVLNINGDVTVKTTKWEVAYDTSSYAETGTVSAKDKSVTKTDYNFTVELAKPGDVYEATVNVVNSGNFNAKLTDIEMSTLSSDQQKYLKYTVTYGNTEYTTSTSGLAVALDAGESETVKVRVEYVKPENSSELPTQDTEVKVSGKLTYALAE